MDNVFEPMDTADVMETVAMATPVVESKKKTTGKKTAVKTKVEGMSLQEKLLEIRVQMLELVTTKSGKNTHSHFDYFQLKDFMPTVLRLFKEYKIYNKFYIDLEDKAVTTVKEVPDTNGVVLNLKEKVSNYVEYAYVYLKDLETGEEELYKKKTEAATVYGASPIQNLGAKTTYMKRYLYMDVLEINIDDEVDAQDKNKGITPYDMPTGNTKPVVNTQPSVAPVSNPRTTTPVSTTAPAPVVTTPEPKQEMGGWVPQGELKEPVFMSLETKTQIAQAIMSKGLNPGEVVRNLATKLNTPVEKLLETHKEFMLEEINKM